MNSSLRKNGRKYFLLFFVLLLFGGTARTGWSAEMEKMKTLTFGVIPQQSAAVIAQSWTPLIDYLGKAAGLPLELKTAKDIATFQERAGAGEFDLIYTNPFHYTVLNRSAGFSAFAKEKERSLKGIIVVKKEGPIQTLEDLEGKTLMVTSPAAFAASILPRAELDHRGISYQTQFSTTQDSIYLAIARGIFPAGGGIQRTFDAMPPEIRDQLRILWTSKGFTPHAFAAHPRVSSMTVEKIQVILEKMDQDPDGRAILEGLGFKGFVKAKNEEYNDVRELKIDSTKMAASSSEK